MDPILLNPDACPPHFLAPRCLHYLLHQDIVLRYLPTTPPTSNRILHEGGYAKVSSNHKGQIATPMGDTFPCLSWMSWESRSDLVKVIAFALALHIAHRTTSQSYQSHHNHRQSHQSHNNHRQSHHNHTTATPHSHHSHTTPLHSHISHIALTH
jgi:hypothetical protein